MHSRPLQEVRAAWLALGLLLGLTLPSPAPVLLGITLLPWLVGGAALFRHRSGDAIPASIARLIQDTAGRMTLLIAGILVVLVVVLTNLFCALLLVTWGAAASLILALVIGPERLAATWQRVVTLGAAIALVCAVLEGVLRLPYFEERFGSPAARVAWERRYDRVAKENAFGFRTVHQTMRRTPRRLRILAIGDSYTWGEKVPSTDSIWPSLLEAQLTRSSPNRPTEVVNISRPGWSTADEVKALERIGWQFQPDRLLIQFYLNDHDPPVGDPRFMRRLGKPPAVLKGGLLQSSALVHLLRVRYWATLGQSALHANLVDNYEDGSAGWKRVSGGLRRIAASARARGVPVTLVIFTAFPPGHWTPESYPYRQIHRKVARTAGAEAWRSWISRPPTPRRARIGAGGGPRLTIGTRTARHTWLRPGPSPGTWWSAAGERAAARQDKIAAVRHRSGRRNNAALILRRLLSLSIWRSTSPPARRDG